MTTITPKMQTSLAAFVLLAASVHAGNAQKISTARQAVKITFRDGKVSGVESRAPALCSGRRQSDLRQ